MKDLKCFECMYEQAMEGQEIKMVKVQALVTFFEKEDAKEFGFAWDNEEKIWYLWVEPNSWYRLKHKTSDKQTFEVKLLAYRFKDGLIKIKPEEV